MSELVNQKTSCGRFRTSVLVGVLLGLSACGHAPEQEKRAIRVLSQQEQIDLVLKESFGGTYNRLATENLQLASRLEGASAFVEPAQTKNQNDGSESTSLNSAPANGTGPIQTQGLQDRGVKAFAVQIKVALSGEESEISAHGILGPKQPAEMLVNDANTNARYSIVARCLSRRCDRILALLVEKFDPFSSSQQTALDDNGKSSRQASVGNRNQKPTSVVYRQAAMIFKKAKKKSPVVSKSDLQAANEQDPLAKENEALPLAGESEVPLFWRATGSSRDFFGGSKASVVEVQMIRAQGAKGHSARINSDATNGEVKGIEVDPNLTEEGMIDSKAENKDGEQRDLNPESN
jgi:hypothetical protein